MKIIFNHEYDSKQSSQNISLTNDIFQASPDQQMLIMSNQIQGPPPPDYMVCAWASCFCLWPLALVAVIKAGESKRFWRSGDVERARMAGKVSLFL